MPRNDLGGALLTRKNLRQQLVEVYPGIEEDETALLDTLEGIDDLPEQIITTLRTAVEREAAATALAEIIKTMTGRKQRLEDGAKTLRVAVLHAMEEAGIPKIPAPDMTVTVGRGKPKVLITDPASVPDDLCRISREPNKTDIAKAIAEKRNVPGVTLGNPQSFLTVRRT